MLKMAIIMAAAVYFTNTLPCRIYEKSSREAALCERNELMTGIYTEGNYGELERRTCPQDIYAVYMAQNENVPYEFLTLCELKDKVPLIILRPTDYKAEGTEELAAALAIYNKPAFVEIDASYSEKAKAFFRNTADKIHLKAPRAAVVWGVSDDKAEKISELYPGDSYADWVALNIAENGADAPFPLDPYPVYTFFSYFEKSKPLMINASLACYSTDGHKYYAAEAAEKVERIYALGEENSSVKAINYFSIGIDNDITCCERALKAFKSATAETSEGDNVRLPLLAYGNNGVFYCERGVIPTEEEYCIINGRRYYKIKNAEKYILIE